MLEYLFFNKVFADKFAIEVKAKQLDYEVKKEAVHDTILILVSEDIDDALWDALDEIYDTLADQDQLLLQTKLEDDSAMNAAGIYIQLKDDKQTIAKIDPDVMNRMLEKISMDELNTFIETIVSSVEAPNDSPICDQ